jgi:hypothetical protein
MKRKILLLEPNYKNKYPPMGLMKIASYFRKKGDDVRFFKGDLKTFAALLLCEEFVASNPRLELETKIPEICEYIRNGKSRDFSKTGLDSESVESEILKSYRNRFNNEIFPKFDIVCVTTLFTFYWVETIDTINFARKLCSKTENVFVGGIAATILPGYIEKETGIKPHIGLLENIDDFGKNDKIIIDEMPLDYSILDEIDYVYPLHNAYFGYTTRGCINRCKFCAVPILEPEFKQYINIEYQIKNTIKQFGEKKDLLLLDNNVLASKCFNRIIDEIKKCGFEKDAEYIPPNEYEIALKNLKDGFNERAQIRKIISIYNEVASKLDENNAGDLYLAREKEHCFYWYTAKKASILKLDTMFSPLYNKTQKSKKMARYIDFNQGIDARLVTKENMEKLAEINIRPLRIAFDRWSMRDIYGRAVRSAINAGITKLSNYMLYNYNDKPLELYLRMKMNVELCEEFRNENVSIFSFPMKYHPISNPKYFKNRNYIGKCWNRKYIRAVQAVLNSTHGKIGRGQSFFLKAFGHDEDEFNKILIMPETFIIKRLQYEDNLTKDWWNKWNKLTNLQREQAEEIIFKNRFTEDIVLNITDSKIRNILEYYRIHK